MSEQVPLRSLHPDMPFAAATREVVYASLATVSVWATFLPDGTRAREHHQMRIALKQLRYSLEFCFDVMPEASACLDDIRQMQAALGTLHDLDVLLHRIETSIQDLDQKRHGKRREDDRARLVARRHSLEALSASVMADRATQHQQCLALWQEIQDRDGFAPLHRALDTLDALPDSVALAPVKEGLQ
jgi:CHAD domain-containing protein